MDKEYVAQYGRLEKTHWWFMVRQRILLQVLKKYIATKPGQPLKILNVGAAAGGSSKWLAALGEVTSLENDPLFIPYLKQQGIDSIEASVTDIPLPNQSFDLVCAFDVIEHVADDNLAIKELVRVCKSNGRVCITVPAFQSLWSTHDLVNGHYRRYTIKQVDQLLQQQPVTKLYNSYFNSLLFIPILIFRKLQLLFHQQPVAGQSDFQYFDANKFFNTAMKKVFGLEVFLLKCIRLPFGVSLLLLLEKQETAKEEIANPR